jgi:DNA sulfur modification protein DndB
MTLKQVAQHVRYAHEVHPTERTNLSHLIQRELNDGRSREIATYLRQNEDRFFNSLVVAVYGGDPAWHEFDVKPTSDDVNREDLSDTALYSMGYLSLTGEEELFALDGQHRVAGIKNVLGHATPMKDDEISVLVVAHHDTDAGIRRTRKLFTTLNRTAKPVKKSEIIALDESDVMAISTRYLVEQHAFFNNGQVDVLKKQANLHPGNFDVFTTIINLYDILSIVFSYVKEKVSDEERAQLRFFRPSDEKVEEYNRFSGEYFERLAANFPELRHYFESDTPVEILRRNRAPDNSHILFRPIGQIMFANVLRKLRATLSLDESMQLIRRLPTRMQGPPYAGVVWNPHRGLVENRREPLCRDLLLHMLRRYTRDREILRQRYAEALERDIETTRLPRPVV